MEIYINNIKQPVLLNSLSVEDEIETRAVCTFSVKDILNTKTFERGMPVQVYDDSEKIFAGYVETSDKVPITYSDNYRHDIVCSDMHYLADKRLISYAARNKLAGDIIKDVVDQKLAEEGVRYYQDISQTDTITEDFSQGTLTDVVAVNDSLELWRPDIYGSFDNSLDLLKKDDTTISPKSGVVATLRPNEGKFGGAVAIEESTTNLFISPRNIDSSDWDKFQLVSSGYINNKIIPDTTSNAHFINQDRVLEVEFYTQSVIAKAEGYNILQIAPSAGFTSEYANFDLENGTIGNTSITYSDLSMTYVGDGYYKCSVTKQSSGSASGRMVMQPMPNDTASRLPVFIGDGVSGILIDKLQLEQKQFATSFVDGSRAGGILPYNSPLFSVNEDWFISFRAKRYDGDAQKFYFDTPNHEVHLYSIGITLNFRIDNGPANETVTTNLYEVDKYFMLSVAKEGAVYSFYVDGELQGSISLSGLIYDGNFQFEVFNGYLDEFIISSEVPSDEKIQRMYNQTLPLERMATGNRVSQIGLSIIGTVDTSSISWVETLNGETITIETSVDGESTWQTATSGSAIPSLPTDVSSTILYIRQTLDTTDTTITPTLESLTIDITTDNPSIEDGIEIVEARFNFTSTEELINSIADKTGFWWKIDSDKVLYFKDRSGEIADWELERQYIRGKPTVKTGNPLYRNQQIIKGPVGLTAEQTDVNYGDGETKAFPLSFSIASEPLVEVSYAAGAWAEQTVGKKGFGDTAQWLWEVEGPIITQADSETRLTSNDRVRVTFIGQFKIIAQTFDPQEVSRQGAIDGTSGIIEDSIQAENVQGREAAIEMGNAKLKKYAQRSTTLSFQTSRKGLQAGQLLTVNGLNAMGIDEGEKLLITKVGKFDEKGLIFQSVEAVKGPKHRSWEELFVELSNRAGLVVNQNIGETEILVIPLDFSKIWTFVENPNIFRQLVADGTYAADSTYTANFRAVDRVTHIAWYNGTTELGRQEVSRTDVNIDDEVETLFYLGPNSANADITHFAWVGGHKSTEEVGTGVLVDKQAYDIIKEETEALQITKNDYSWNF